jgi:hypothetical protein
MWLILQNENKSRSWNGTGVVTCMELCSIHEDNDFLCLAELKVFVRG